MLGRILTARLPTWEALISRLGLSQEQGRFLSRALLLALGVRPGSTMSSLRLAHYIIEANGDQTMA